MKKILLFLTIFGILLSTANIFSETTTTLKTEKIKYPKGIRNLLQKCLELDSKSDILF